MTDDPARKGFDELVIQSIASQFFAPRFSHTDSVTGAPQYMQPPVDGFFNALYERNKESLVAAVQERMTVSDMVDRLASSIATVLSAAPTSGGYGRIDYAQKYRDQINEAVIAKLAEYEVERIRAEQAAQ